MKRFSLFATIALILTMAVSVSSCAQAKTTVKLSAAKITLNKGKSKTLTLKGAGSKVNFKITSGKTIVKIKRKSNTSVKVTALKKGTAKIKATLGKKSYKCTVSVKENTKMTVKVNGKTFTAKLNSSKAAEQFIKKLPLSITMNELNGNEKYHYFGTGFTGNAKTYSEINAGDLMIYGDDCLVLFYDKIVNSPYKYIKIGRLDSASGLKKALGSGDVRIEFKE